jgi:hypothetical protein
VVFFCEHGNEPSRNFLTSGVTVSFSTRALLPEFVVVVIVVIVVVIIVIIIIIIIIIIIKPMCN